MIDLETEKLELRGLKNSKSKKGNVYYVLNCENISNGDPCQFYCPKADLLPVGLKKGDKIKIKVTYNKFKELAVTKIEKVG